MTNDISEVGYNFEHIYCFGKPSIKSSQYLGYLLLPQQANSFWIARNFGQRGTHTNRLMMFFDKKLYGMQTQRERINQWPLFPSYCKNIVRKVCEVETSFKKTASTAIARFRKNVKVFDMPIYPVNMTIFHEPQVRGLSAS